MPCPVPAFFRFGAARRLLVLNSAGVAALLGRHVMQIISDMEHTVLVHPSVVFRPNGRQA
jgi:hypothetical protein